MDAFFLKYYNEELSYIRHVAREFADMNEVARHLSLEEEHCPDPYVERLLEGVAFLAARTRLKVDTETSRLNRDMLEMLYPDLAAPTPALGRVVLQPGDKVNGMYNGYTVERHSKLVADPQEGLRTRATYSTCQDVTLWPIRVQSVEQLSGESRLESAGLSSSVTRGAAAALRIEIVPTGVDPLSAYALDQLDIAFDQGSMSGALFDAIHGSSTGVVAGPSSHSNKILRLGRPGIIGLLDDEALFPRTRNSFEGYRLLREYFVMPERFLTARISGLREAVRQTDEGALQIFILLSRPVPDINTVRPENFLLFSTPIINLFEKDCSTIDVDPRKNGQVVHADRSRAQDFEIYSLVSVKDLDRDDGDESTLPSAASIAALATDGPVYSIERRPRRAGNAERTSGKFRSTYNGDDVFISLSQRRGRDKRRPIKRLDIRARCTNRDLAVLERTPRLTTQNSVPVENVRLVAAIRRPMPALHTGLLDVDGAVAELEDTSWHLIAQLSLNFLSLAESGDAASPLRGLLELYASRGDRALMNHARALINVTSKEVPERLPLDGPTSFGFVTEIKLSFDDQLFAGQSKLLLGALLNQLFKRYAGLNCFVRCRTELSRSGEQVLWPMIAGSRRSI